MASAVTFESQTIEAKNENLSFKEIHGVLVPTEFTDPVTGKLIEDAVILFPSGKTYNRATIEKIQMENVLAKEPETNCLIVAVAPNLALNESIKKFLLLNPKLQENLEQERSMALQQEKTYAFTANTFMRLFAENDNFTIPPNKECTIEASRLMCWRGGFSGNVVQQFTIATQIINNALLPLGKTLRLMDFKRGNNIALSTHLLDGSAFLKLRSSEGIEITTTRSDLSTSCKNLFKRMLASQIYSIKIEPGQAIIFTEIVNEDLAKIVLNAYKNLSDYLGANKPQKCEKIRIYTEGCITFDIDTEKAPNSIEMSNPDSEIYIELFTKQEPALSL